MIAQEVLESESSQELKSLLRSRVLTFDDGFMGLWRVDIVRLSAFGLQVNIFR